MLWSRPDGVPVQGESALRRIMPFIMRGRNESVVLHDMVLDLSRTLPWLAQYNQLRPAPMRATVFHLLLFACARALHRRPGLNRFVSGGTIYQRRDVTISFSAKQKMHERAPMMTVKVAFPDDPSFDAVIERAQQRLSEGRSGRDRPVDKEVKLATRLPSFVLRAGVSGVRLLDSLNLLPASMIENDPLYASLFLANVGSVGLDEVTHHLYEYGTISVFGVMGRIEKKVFVSESGALAVRDGAKIRWSFDERINDGLYCAKSLALAQQIMEDPGSVLGPPLLERPAHVPGVTHAAVESQPL